MNLTVKPYNNFNKAQSNSDLVDLVFLEVLKIISSKILWIKEVWNTNS